MMMRDNWKKVEGTGVPLSYALTAFFIVLPILSYDIFFYYHLITEFQSMQDNPALKIEKLDIALYAAMGLG